MVMAPVSSRIIAEPGVVRQVSPLNMIFVTPKTEIHAAGNVTIDAPENELTEVTDANEESLLKNGFARAAYDYIESGSSVRIWVLPFEVDTTDNGAAARLARVVAAIRVLDDDDELRKLPHQRVPAILCPRETALGSTANPALAALELAYDVNLHIGAVSFVDAGPVTVDAANDRVAAGAGPSQADVLTWDGNNSHPGICAVTNRGDIPGYNRMWGSVIAAAHWARRTSVHGLHYQPTTFQDPIAGLSVLDPRRAWVPRDAGSPAHVLAFAPNYLSSLIQWEGRDFLYGGRTQHADNDPRRVLAHDIISNEMVAQTQRDLVDYRDHPNTPETQARLQRHIKLDLEASFIGRPLRSLTVFPPTRQGQHLEVEFLAQFPDLIESVRLTARVTTQEVA